MNASTTQDREQSAPGPNGHPEQHPAEHQHEGEGVPKDLKHASGFTVFVLVTAFVVFLISLFLVGFIPSILEEHRVRADAAARGGAKPVVQWTNPTLSNGEKDVILPCDVDAYQQTAIFTRTNGYLKEWHYDIGQRVEKNGLMAVIETPEVDAELAQSKATLEQNRANVVKAQADEDLAKKTLDRYTESQEKSPGSVTKEQIDQQQAAYEDAIAALKQVEASVTQAQANVQQLQVTVDFEHVVAPFSGTVTARNYDVGALLSPTTSKEIFDLAQTDKMRVFVNVPQGYANNIRQGQKAYLAVRNFPGKEFEGTVTLTAGAVDPNTRTLRVQIDFDNKDGNLFAGEYGQVRLPVTPQQPVSIIPSSSLVFNAAGTEVATLSDDDKVHIKNITVGRDLGTELEVTKGLSPQDRVIVNPAEQTVEGAEVTAEQAPQEPQSVPVKPAATQPAVAAVDTGSIVTGNATK